MYVLGSFSYELFMHLLQAPVSSVFEAVYNVLKDISEHINAKVHKTLVPDHCVDKSFYDGP